MIYKKLESFIIFANIISYRCSYLCIRINVETIDENITINFKDEQKTTFLISASTTYLG